MAYRHTSVPRRKPGTKAPTPHVSAPSLSPVSNTTATLSKTLPWGWWEKRRLIEQICGGIACAARLASKTYLFSLIRRDPLLLLFAPSRAVKWDDRLRIYSDIDLGFFFVTTFL